MEHLCAEDVRAVLEQIGNASARFTPVFAVLLPSEPVVFRSTIEEALKESPYAPRRLTLRAEQAMLKEMGEVRVQRIYVADATIDHDEAQSGDFGARVIAEKTCPGVGFAINENGAFVIASPSRILRSRPLENAR